MEPNAEHPIKTETSQLKPGDTVWAKVPGRYGKLVTVRAIVDVVHSDKTLLVELYPEFQLPVRFMVVVARENIEPN